jgi:hypothetical protein
MQKFNISVWHLFMNSTIYNVDEEELLTIYWIMKINLLKLIRVTSRKHEMQNINVRSNIIFL